MIPQIFAICYEKFVIQSFPVHYSMMNISVIKQDITHEKNAINSATYDRMQRAAKARKKIDDRKARGYSKSRPGESSERTMRLKFKL